MASPFRYPKVKHLRTRTPPVYKRYQQYKPDLQQEFAGRCVYCRAMDKVKGYEGFGVDHYRPKEDFPHLATEYLNLYYACNRCNSFKGRFWPTRAQMKAKVFVPNPCEHVMDDHLRYRAGTVAHRSNAGEFSIELLDLNEPSVVQLRDALTRAVDAISARIKTSKNTIAQIQKIRVRAKRPAEKARTDSDLSEAKRNLQQLKDALNQFSG